MALRNLSPKVATLDTRSARLAPTESNNPLYQSQVWRTLVRELKLERGERCEECRCDNRRLVGDHVKEIKDGGAPLDPLNVRLLCYSCHTKKTVNARKIRMATSPSGVNAT